MKRLLALPFAFLLHAPAPARLAAQQRCAMTAQEFIELERPTEPALSRGRHEMLHIVGASGDVHEIMTDMNPGQMSVATSPGRITAAYVSDAADKPADVYVMTVDHRNPEPVRNLSRLNTALLAQVQLNPAREVGWVGADGDSVFAWVDLGRPAS